MASLAAAPAEAAIFAKAADEGQRKEALLRERGHRVRFRRRLRVAGGKVVFIYSPMWAQAVGNTFRGKGREREAQR